jgi:hypothetical protein
MSFNGFHSLDSTVGSADTHIGAIADTVGVSQLRSTFGSTLGRRQQRRPRHHFSIHREMRYPIERRFARPVSFTGMPGVRKATLWHQAASFDQLLCGIVEFDGSYKVL